MICRILAVALVFAVSSSAFAQNTKQPAKRPNILFILTDDQRADTIAALGNKHIKTPNLDRLVQSGVAFRRAYCMGGLQGAVCVPSRAMILTGRSLFHVNENITGMTTWPEMFARAGYVTFATGKWHNGRPSLIQSFGKASSIFFGGMTATPFGVPLATLKDDRKTFSIEKDRKHTSERFTDEAIAFLKSRDKAKPFLAYIALNIPHDPRLAPKKYHEMYDKDQPPLPANFLPIHPFDYGEMTGRDEKLAPFPRTPEIVRKELADYYACITFLDEQVGRLLQALQQTGELENTIIVFTSDHGLAIGSHGLFGKQNLYDDSMHAPLLIAGPGIPKGQTTDAFAYLFDLFPTLGGLAGVDGPEGSEGMSLAPFFTGDTKGSRRTLFTAYRHLQRSIRDDRFHLIVYPTINRVQLFDLSRDPHETKDISGAKENAGEIERLTKLLEETQKSLDDKQPLRSKKPASDKFELPKSVSGDATIRGRFGNNDIIITTTDRVAGAIHSLHWRGKEFLDSTDHGRQMQSACSFQNGGGRFNAEVYNPTEAGSRRDGVGPKSTSKLIELTAQNNVLKTRSQMAFWLPPGEKSDGDLARNDKVLSEHLLTKTVRIGYDKLPNVIEYEATFTVPRDEQASYAQFEAVTGYMPAEFKDFWKLDLKTGRIEQIDFGPGEQEFPLIFSTPDGLYAMGCYSPDQPSKGFEKAGYGRWRFKSERVVKWNIVFRLRDGRGVSPGEYTFRNFVAVGTLDDVRDALTKLAGSFAK